MIMSFFINPEKENSEQEIADLLKACIRKHRDAWSEIVFLCVGTDRCTGDCLGPCVGQQLLSCNIPGIFIYGTLHHPVHAMNLTETRRRIRQEHPGALIIAVDASLGQKKHLGCVTIANGALHPGAAVQKKLPPVGHIHITGIVNVSGALEMLTLQTTRLSTVLVIADKISEGILLLLTQQCVRSALYQTQENCCAALSCFSPQKP